MWLVWGGAVLVSLAAMVVVGVSWQNVRKEGRKAAAKNRSEDRRKEREREKEREQERERERESFHVRHVAVVRSCYPTRNGTPRQPCLVPSSRGLIWSLAEDEEDEMWEEWQRLLDQLGGEEGRPSPSHWLWVTFAFHTNTNHHKQSFRPRIRPPRLGSAMVGAFATRTPHRPNPVGISLCRVEGVEGGSIAVRGLDLVDGTPVLALQVYADHPLDGPPHRVPEWLSDPISTQRVEWAQEARDTLARHWQSPSGGHPAQSLFKEAAEVELFIHETLTYDIRSHRHKGKGLEGAALVYRVYLDTVDVVWRVVQPGLVVVQEIVLLEKPGSSPLNPSSAILLG